ncbi:MAG: hypothetical protein HYX91_03665 [Chloroflexi bacterium]|nr:hypothetical protein [Chloroflexota bacterium]
MPAPHSRGKHHGKKGHARKPHPQLPAQPQAPSLPAAAPRPAVSAPAGPPPARIPIVSKARYQYVPRDLKRIGILGGAVLVILIILSLILS